MKTPKLHICLSNYAYGKVTKRLRNAVQWIHSNKSKIFKDILQENISQEFDFDDYWGMPKNICNQLSTDEVDFIQEEVGDFRDEINNVITYKEADEEKKENKYKRYKTIYQIAKYLLINWTEISCVDEFLDDAATVYYMANHQELKIDELATQKTIKKAIEKQVKIDLKAIRKLKKNGVKFDK